MSFISALKSFFGLSSSSETPALQPGDKLLHCEDCGNKFVFDAGEQRFFKEKGFTEPKRCPKCRKKVRFRIRRRGRGRGHGGGQGGGQQQQQHNQQQNQHHQQNRRNRHHGRRHSVIDGDSPYADER